MCSSTRGPAMVAGLGDVAHEEDRHALLLGHAQQLRRALAHLAHAAGGRGQRVGVDGLDRIDHHQPRPELADVLQDRFEVGLGVDVEVGLWMPRRLGAQLELARALPPR
jgi:hypothetical protein